VTSRLQKIVRSAAAELARRRYAGSILRLLALLEEFSDSTTFADSGDSVIFYTPGDFLHLRAPAPVRERLIVATHPYITPLLPHLIPEREFYVLSVNTKHLQFGRWRAGECKEVSLPRSIPPSLKDAGGFDRPDHDLEGRSAAGSSTAQMRGAGMSSDREKSQGRLHDYLRMVDRELASLLGGATLVLVGGAEEMAAYREAAEYPTVLEARHTSAAHLTWREMGKLAVEAVLSARRAEGGPLLDELHEANRRNHVARGVREIWEAAHQGRVHKLVLAKGSEFQGLLGPLDSIAEAQPEAEEDLLNAAAVETIRAGGEVHMLDSHQLAYLGPAAALLRYSFATD